jgi:PAS domain S-box-containing protein
VLQTGFQEKIRWQELRSLRLLNVMVAVIITVLGFVFEFAYHDGIILATGLAISLVFTANYFLSVYSPGVQKHFTNLTYVSILLLHAWAVYVAYLRQFEIEFLLPVALSTFIFSLIFDKFYKSFLFIFSVTSLLLLMMLYSGSWKNEYTIALAALYSGAVLTDVIMKRKNEYHREIERREDQYITLVENMNDGLIYLDPALLITFVNDRFCDITGYNREELIGRHVLNIYPAGEASRIALRFFNQLSSGHHARAENDMLKLDGSTVAVQMAGAPLKLTPGFRVVYADISALKHAQEELKKREEAYRTFIGQSAVGIWRGEYLRPVPVDLPVEEQVQMILNGGTLAECNDYMASMYGFRTAADLTGKGIRDLYAFDSDDDFDIAKTRELVAMFVDNQYRLSNVETRGRDALGGTRYYLNNIIGIVENGALVRTWGIQSDITARKKTERELLQTNQELDTFFYKASHDLKGPLASIMGIVNLARLENSPDELPRYLEMIESSTRRLDNTLLDLIELARTRRGVGKLNRINLSILLEEVLYSLKHLPGYDAMEVVKEVDRNLEIFSDQLLVQSILQNLIHNAINYRSKKEARVTIQAVRNEGDVELTIADNGLGIPDEIKSKVFEMFYRGHPDSSGSGLGLFIVRNAVDKLRGRITFDSQVGKGTRFRVVLPDLQSENE